MSETVLTGLVTHLYQARSVSLQSVHRIAHDDRALFRVDRAEGAPWLLRAFRGNDNDAALWLLKSAATLLFLERQKYPAPRIVRPVNQTLVGEYEGWSSLMLTFVEGEVTQGGPSDLREIGAVLAQLHRLDTKTLPVPASRFHPTHVVKHMLAQLATLQSQVPAQLSELYDVGTAIFERVSQWQDLPKAMLHTDPWAYNAVRTPDHQITLIDWDGAGLGPAILDVGYLLVNSLATLPAWPTLDPKPQQIAAVVDGYCQERLLSRDEISHLSDAIWFAVIYHDVRDFKQMLHDDEFAVHSLRRFEVRYPAIAEIARQATQHFERYL